MKTFIVSTILIFTTLPALASSQIFCTTFGHDHRHEYRENVEFRLNHQRTPLQVRVIREWNNKLEVNRRKATPEKFIKDDSLTETYWRYNVSAGPSDLRYVHHYLAIPKMFNFEDPDFTAYLDIIYSQGGWNRFRLACRHTSNDEG